MADFTWLDLITQISFRLNRIDLPDQFVRQMLKERADFYGPQVLDPAEVVDTSIVTVPGQTFYPLPAGTQKINYVRVLQGGVWIPVAAADHYDEILYADPLQPPFTSLPVSLYALLGSMIRLFPTPSANFPVELTMEQTIGIPVDDTDTTNFWVTDGRILLINATCGEICREYLDIEIPQSPRIQVFDQNTQMALDKLMHKAHELSTPSIMKQHL